MVYWPDNDVDVEKTAAATEIAIRKVGPASIRRALPVPNERLLGRKPAGADAADLPDGHSIRQWVLDTIKNQPDSAAETGNSNVAIRRPDWAGIGEAAVQILPLRYRYVPDSDMWYRWTGCKWKFASTAPKEIVDAIEANRYDIANKMSISGYSEHATILIRRSPNGAVSKSDLVQQFRNAYRGTRPVPPLAGAVATPEGVVDIKTGVVVRHDWQRHDTTAVTNGHYRPQDADLLYEHVWKEMEPPLVRRVSLDALLDLLAIAISGRAYEYRSVAIFWGETGSGKGATIRLIAAAFGDLAVPSNLSILRDNGSEISNSKTQLIERQPAIITLPEIGARGRWTSSAINALTGDHVSARRTSRRATRSRRNCGRC